MGWISDFQKFAMRGTLVDLAVGFTVGAAFSTVAKSLVDDVIMPPVGLLMGGTDFSDLFAVLREGAQAGPYATLAAAKAAGAVTLNFGLFVNAIIAFLVVALAMFWIIRLISRAEQAMEGEKPAAPEEPANKKCVFCQTTIPYRASRCPHCTSQLEGAKAA